MNVTDEDIDKLIKSMKEMVGHAYGSVPYIKTDPMHQNAIDVLAAAEAMASLKAERNLRRSLNDCKEGDAEG